MITQEDIVHLCEAPARVSMRTQAIARPLRYCRMASEADIERGLESISQKIEENRNDANAYLARGCGYELQGKFELAIADFTKSIELNIPNRAQAYFFRGDSYKSSGDLSLAIRDYDKVIEIDPNYSSAYCNRAYIHKTQENFELAIADLQKVIEIDPNHIEAHNNLGLVYLELDNLCSAMDKYKEAIKINPNYRNIHLIYTNLAQAQELHGYLEEAITNYTQSINRNPNATSLVLAESYHDRSRVYKIQEKFDLALEDVKQAKQLNPNIKDIDKTIQTLKDKLSERKTNQRKKNKRKDSDAPNTTQAVDKYNLRKRKTQKT